MTLWAWIKQTLRGEYFSQDEAKQRARHYSSFVSDQILNPVANGRRNLWKGAHDDETTLLW